MNDVDAARDILTAHGEDLAAVLLDPLPSRLMFVPMTPEFAQGVVSLARDLGALAILDEVYTLRLDTPGRQPALGISADLVTMGKIIGGGLPIGAFGGTREAMSVFDQTLGHAKVGHGGTFNASPLAMAAGLAAMKALDAGRMAHINALGDRLRSGLQLILRELNLGGPVLGVGSLATLMPGVSGPVETIRDVVREADVFRFLSHAQVELLNRGVFINPALHYVISTAMTAADIDQTLDATRSALRAAAAQH
jgi:glutamate-1-semialdehyde 2,1-aminomutase